MRLVLALLAAAVALVAQTGGSVTGTVASTTTHAGVPGVRVELTAVNGQAAAYVTATDAAGQFAFPDVRPGDYTVSFSSRQVVGPGPGHPARRPFHVAAGGEPVRIRVELEPWGKLSGRVLDEQGHPVAKARVMMQRLHGGGGSVTNSDQDGRFQIGGMGQGAYVLAVRAQTPHPRAAEGLTWAPAFFPNGTERSQAQPIYIRAGSDLSGYEVRLRAVRAVHLHGKAIDERGQGLPDARVWLRDGPWDKMEAKAADGGVFEFPPLPPGSVQLLAECQRGKELLKGWAEIAAGQKDLEDISLRLLPPFTVHGLVERDEPRDGQGKRKVTAVYLVSPEGPIQPMAFHEQDGSFAISDVYPGRYRITPAGFVPGYYLDSVMLGERNVLGQEVELTPASPPIHVVYRSKAARVRGSVADGAGTQVYLLPQDEALLNGQFIRSARCENGRFEVDSLRPGDYYAFAFDRVEFAALEDAGFVRALISGAARVHVEEGEIASVDLKVTPWPE